LPVERGGDLLGDAVGVVVVGAADVRVVVGDFRRALGAVVFEGRLVLPVDAAFDLGAAVALVELELVTAERWIRALGGRSFDIEQNSSQSINRIA
jgi:hypothetical protein